MFKTYSQRKKEAGKAGEQDVYSYGSLPEFLRHQIATAFHEGIGRFVHYSQYSLHMAKANSLWIEMDKLCRKNIWAYVQMAGPNSGPHDNFLNFIMEANEIDDLLSAIEIGCISLESVIEQPPQSRAAESASSVCLAEINNRFLQHQIGYQFENGEIIRVDSKLIHSEVIKPALSLLAKPMFKKANIDFMTAHRHLRIGEYKDCVTAANRAFESTLKAICDKKRWSYKAGDNAAQLITLVSEKGLFTHDFDKSFTAYTAMMKSGLPSVRNQAGGHGEGIEAVAVTSEIARYAINLTATNIVFLADSYEANK